MQKKNYFKENSNISYFQNERSILLHFCFFMFVSYLNIRNTKYIMVISAIVTILNNLLLYSIICTTVAKNTIRTKKQEATYRILLK